MRLPSRAPTTVRPTGSYTATLPGDTEGRLCCYETGLDFAQARCYAGAHGRFTSVAPLQASPAPAAPQTWNRYSYGVGM